MDQQGMGRRTALKLVAAGVVAERVQVAGGQLIGLGPGPRRIRAPLL